jgi:hypothetical protein
MVLPVTADHFQFSSMLKGEPEILQFIRMRGRLKLHFRMRQHSFFTPADAANDAFDA